MQKRFINIKNDDNKCFLWCHVRDLHALKTHPERVTKADRKMICSLDYSDVKFPVSKKDYVRTKRIMIFAYENVLTYPVHAPDEKFEDCTNLFLITDKNKLHYVYIKDFNRFMCHKTKHKNKKYFWRYCLQCFYSEKVLVEHEEFFLVVNGKLNIKLLNGSIKFNYYSKQLATPLKIYADF